MWDFQLLHAMELKKQFLFQTITVRQQVQVNGAFREVVDLIITRSIWCKEVILNTYLFEKIYLFIMIYVSLLK